MTQSRYNIFSSPQKVLSVVNPQPPLLWLQATNGLISVPTVLIFTLKYYTLLEVAERGHAHQLQLLPILTTSDSTSVYRHQLILRNIIGP